MSFNHISVIAFDIYIETLFYIMYDTINVMMIRWEG